MLKDAGLSIILVIGIIFGLPLFFFKKLTCFLTGHIYESETILINSIGQCERCEEIVKFNKDDWYFGLHFKGAIQQLQKCVFRSDVI